MHAKALSCTQSRRGQTCDAHVRTTRYDGAETRCSRRCRCRSRTCRAGCPPVDARGSASVVEKAEWIGNKLTPAESRISHEHTRSRSCEVGGIRHPRDIEPWVATISTRQDKPSRDIQIWSFLLGEIIILKNQDCAREVRLQSASSVTVFTCAQSRRKT